MSDSRSRHAAAYDEPFGWWGPVWAPPIPRSILDLITETVLTAEVAGLLWAALARRASLVVAAAPRGAGKTTLLTALLDFLPPETRRVYLRGCYESFAFLTDPAVEPASSYLLVNEVSAHLPSYLWGPGVRRVLGAVRSGFSLAATAHAATAEEFVASLAGYPLRIPLVEIAKIDLVVILDAWEAGETVCREVRSVAALHAEREGLRIDLLAERTARRAALRVDAARLDHLAPPPEIVQRAAALAELATTPMTARATPAALHDLAARWVPPAAMG